MTPNRCNDCGDRCKGSLCTGCADAREAAGARFLTAEELELIGKPGEDDARHEAHEYDDERVAS